MLSSTLQRATAPLPARCLPGHQVVSGGALLRARSANSGLCHDGRLGVAGPPTPRMTRSLRGSSPQAGPPLSRAAAAHRCRPCLRPPGSGVTRPPLQPASPQGHDVTDSAAGHSTQPRQMELVVVPRSDELQAAEDALGLALVALLGGTRAPMSPAMVCRYLYDCFGILAEEVDVRRHDPEDFVVRFHHRTDHDRVLAAPPMGSLLPLIWRP